MSLRSFCGYTLLFVLAKCAFAQNLTKNPSFDTDTSDWTTSAFGLWSDAENHGPTGQGALELSAIGATEYASQCVLVSENVTYVFSAWIKNSMTGAPHVCGGPEWETRIDWSTDSSCGSAFSFIADNDAPRGSGSWFNSMFASPAPTGSHSALITLKSECTTHDGGTSTFFFDDVTFETDAIFKNDFEVHAHEGGPGGSG
jgi:hypothetical protein